MKKWILNIGILFLFGQSIFCQVAGTIINSDTKEPISYVNIGVRNKSVGTVSDYQGNFKLKLTDKILNEDKIIFSHIGYESQEFKVSFLLSKQITLKLMPLATILEEVVVEYKVPKAKKMGRNGKGLGFLHFNFYSAGEADVDDRLSKEMGVRLKIRKNCYVEALNFNITSNEFKSLKFRINFYSLKNGDPEELLNTRDIIFEIKNQYLGWYKVDLSKYNVYLEKEEEQVVVSIQWLESKKENVGSKYFSISSAGATSKKFFYREKALDKWVSSKSKPSFYIDAKCN